MYQMDCSALCHKGLEETFEKRAEWLSAEPVSLSAPSGGLNITAFHLMMTTFLDYWKDKAPEFISYFEQYYVHRPGNYSTHCI